ncbi:response regulator [Halonatronum saccharophilum]|uniref:response regulator n=1 Tax=Halonatronum saccharophilum TaxID=150060 RepID=UPI000488221E|nr:response regulator transcription factor [Halonatronum saccharophilum]
MIKVFLVDDHPFVLQGLESYLSTQDNIEVIGVSQSGREAIEEIKRLKPDVATVDLHLGDISGIEITAQIKKEGIGTEVIILSSFSKDEEIIAAIDAGALSYLMKDSPPQKLVEAIFAASKGEPVLHPRIAKKIMKRATGKDLSIEPLTTREEDVLACLVKGKSNKEVGEELYISTRTVKTHVSNILKKLDVNDRTQAVIKAIDNNLVKR